MDRHRGEGRLYEKLVKSICSGSRPDEDDYLVKLEGVKELNEFAILLFLFKLAEILLETMQGESSLTVDRDFERLLHELLARLSDLCIQRSREHLHLLLVRRLLEDVLHVRPHVQLFKHLVTLIEDEMLQIARVEMATTHKVCDTARSSDNDRRWALLKLSNLNRHRLATE